MWNLTDGTNELLNENETDSYTQRADCGQWGQRGMNQESGISECKQIYGMDKQKFLLYSIGNKFNIL